MSKSTIAALLCALSLAAPVLAAPAQPASSTPVAPSAAVQVETVTRLPQTLTPDEFQYIGGRYNLDNGATLRFTQFHNKLYAQVAELPPTQVMMLGQNMFAAPDNSIKMTFQPDPSGFSTGVTVRYTTDKSMGETVAQN